MFNLKEYDMALKYFNKIIKTYPDRTSLVRDSEINIAKCLYGLGDIKEALKRFKIIAYKYPKTPTELEVLLWISDYYLKALDYDNSILYYRQILAHFPESEKEAIARYGLGEAYMLKGEYDEALNQLKLIDEKKDPLLSSKAKLLIAEIFSKQLDPATAIKKYRTIAKNSPEFERNASIKISELYMKAENFESALQALTDALKASPEHSEITNAELQFRIGDSLELMHKRNEAIEAYLKIPYLYPDRTTWVIKAYLRIAKIFEDEEDWENAKLVYNKIIDYGTDEVKFAQERIEWINTYIQD